MDTLVFLEAIYVEGMGEECMGVEEGMSRCYVCCCAAQLKW